MRVVARRLVVAWGLVVGGLALALGPDAPALTRALMVAAVGGLVLASAMTAAVFSRARTGEVAATGAPEFRFWRLCAPPLVLGGLLGALIGAAAWAPVSPKLSGGLGVLLAAACAIPLGLAWGRRVRVPRSRDTGLVAWLVLDTALPLALVASLAGWLIVGWRFGDRAAPLSSVEVARHLAGTALVQGVLGGLAGLLKVGRERLASLVKAPEASAPLAPGPVVVSLIGFIVILLGGPFVLPELSVSALALIKVPFSFVVVALCAGLGATRGAGPLGDRYGNDRRALDVHD